MIRPNQSGQALFRSPPVPHEPAIEALAERLREQV